MATPLVFASSALGIGGFSWTGGYTAVDLIAAGTNALNGALLARRPDVDPEPEQPGAGVHPTRERQPSGSEA